MSGSRIISLLTCTSKSGAACLRRLIQSEDLDGITIRAGCRTKSKAETIFEGLRSDFPNFDAKVSMFEGCDAADPESLRALFDGADAALIVTPLDHARGFGQDAELSIAMMKAAVAGGVKQLVYVGSWTVKAADTVSMIANRFVATEKYMQEELPPEVSWTSLRAGYFNDNFLLAAQGIKNGSLAMPKGFALPPVYVPDIGRCAAVILADPAKADLYNKKCLEISGPEILTLVQIAEIFSEELGTKVQAVELEVETMEGKAPPFIVELYRHLSTCGRDAVPFSKDTEALLGEHTPLRTWIKENLGAFQ